MAGRQGEKVPSQGLVIYEFGNPLASKALMLASGATSDGYVGGEDRKA